MNSTVAFFLLQDGVNNGAVYALLGVTLVLVFAVTRVIFVPQGEFVAWGALTLAAFESGTVPGTARLLVALGIVAAFSDLIRGRRTLKPRLIAMTIARDVGYPLIMLAIVTVIAPLKLGPLVNVVLTLALIVPMGPLIYRLAFQPFAEASVLTLFITAIGVHFAMVGLGLLFFGAEGYRTQPFIAGVLRAGTMIIKGQSLIVLAVTVAVLGALYAFFERTLMGKALRATAFNRLGARLVGIPVRGTGQIAFALASAIGAISGLMIGSLTTIYYDTGFLIGLKGFVAAIIAGLASYPGTALAALAVGIFESFVAFYASAYKEIIIFALIIPVLFWRSFGKGHHDDEE